MRFQDPGLRQRLAMEYVLGTLKPLSRARLERRLGEDAALRRLVGQWEARFAGLDDRLAPLQPPARLWRSLARQVEPPAAGARRLLRWRLATAAASAVALVALGWAALAPVPAPVLPPVPPRVLAVLVSPDGRPAWVALAQSGRAVLLQPAGAAAADAAHDYELWAVSGGGARPLGVLSRSGGDRLDAPALPAGTVLAISLEPRGGSPTGLPTGPVVFQATLPQAF